ncbi:MAG: hypothetical protein AAF911_09275, partial [Planctomycetota bacterium]
MTTAPVAAPAPTLPASPAAAAAEAAGRDVTWPAVGAIWKREVKRFFRQRNRVIGAVATPVVFWLLLGLGLNETFRVNPGEVSGGVVLTDVGTPGVDSGAASDIGYLAFFFPGMVVLMVLFT